jgi:hypothetical protein
MPAFPFLKPVTGKPGLMQTSEGKLVKMTETFQGMIYDSVIIGDTATTIKDGVATAEIEFGQSWVFFRDLTGKELSDCNISLQKALAAGESLTATRVGLYFGKFIGNYQVNDENVLKFVENAYFELNRNRVQKVIEGPAIAFPPGMGWYGGDALSLGLPSLVASQPLSDPIELSSDMTVEGRLTLSRKDWAKTQFGGSLFEDKILFQDSVPSGKSEWYCAIIAKCILYGRYKRPAVAA